VNVLKLGIIILLTISIDTSARVFDDLFIVRIPQDDYEITNDGLIMAFNKITVRLTGSRNPAILRSINSLGLNKASLVQSYKVIEFEGESLLEVIFNKEPLIKLFRDQKIPIYGVNRPELTILAKIDDGLNPIFYLYEDRALSNESETSEFIESLNDLSRERGLHIDLPLSDIAFSQTINSSNVLNNLQESLKSNYSYGFVREFEVFRDSIATWTLRMSANNYRFNDLNELFQFALVNIDKDIDNLLEIDANKDSQGSITINALELKSFEEYENFQAVLEEIFSISNIELLRANKERFLFSGNIESSIMQIKKELYAHSYLQIISFDEERRNIDLKLIN
jgi:hypothetical protein